MLGDEAAAMGRILSGERHPVDLQVPDLIFPTLVLSVHCWVYKPGPAPPASQSLKSGRPISDSSVFFSGRELSHTKLSQILVVALIDLVHGEIFFAHHVEPRFHMETIVSGIVHTRSPVSHPNSELLATRPI